MNWLRPVRLKKKWLNAGASCASTRRHIKHRQALDTVVDPGNAPSVHTRSGIDMAGVRVAGLCGQVAQGIEGRCLYQLTIGRINKFYGVRPYIVEPALHLKERRERYLFLADECT